MRKKIFAKWIQKEKYPQMFIYPLMSWMEWKDIWPMAKLIALRMWSQKYRKKKGKEKKWVACALVGHRPALCVKKTGARERRLLGYYPHRTCTPPLIYNSDVELGKPHFSMKICFSVLCGMFCWPSSHWLFWHFLEQVVWIKSWEGKPRVIHTFWSRSNWTAAPEPLKTKRGERPQIWNVKGH